MEGTLRLAGVVNESIVDGPGIRYTIFVQGCPHHCPGCHNPQTHDFAGGTEVAWQALVDAIDQAPFVSGITFSGGEPFCQAAGLLPLAQALKARGKHLMAYTGYTFEELLDLEDAAVYPLLEQLDLLVDGRFLAGQKSLDLRFRGSTNQRILDVPASLQTNTPVWAEQYR